MKFLSQVIYGIVAAVVVSTVLILTSSFGEARHTLSIIGAIAIVLASLYIVRTRWVRWGRRGVWLKFHQNFAVFGLCLVLLHSGIKPLAWHSWLTFVLAWGNLGTGVAVSLTKGQTRRILLRCHLILAPVLLVGILLHGREKLDHDAFMPLTQEHDVPCVKCHTSQPLLFQVEAFLENDLHNDGQLSDNMQWEFQSRGIPVSEDTTVAIQKEDRRWLITDRKNRQVYRLLKETDGLNIYANSVYKTYTCRTCHVHDTDEIKSAHEIHGVIPYDRCFDCHQAMLDEKTYGKRRASWTYDLER